MNLFGEIPYAEMQSMIDDPPGKRNWWTAEYLTGFPDDAIDALLRVLGADAELVHAVARRRLGRRGRGQRATPRRSHRDAAWVVHPFCVWEGAERDAEHIAWGREGREALAA